MRLLIWTAFLALSFPSTGTPSLRQDTAAAAISRMYADFAWEAKDENVAKKEPLFSASLDVMSRYLDAELIKAILADRKCVELFGGECNLNFEPMWDSQDPGGVVVHVVGTKTPAIVQARIHYPYQSETRVVTYRMRQTPAGWRVADMGGAAWPSLLQLLHRPVK